MLSLPINIIVKNTCISRGKSNTDKFTKKRWFSFYGTERNKETFCNSKKFIEKYADGGYEYFKITKNIQLLYIPYINLEVYNDDEFIKAIEIANELINYVFNHKDSSETVNKYGFDTVCRDILAVLFVSDEENLMNTKNLKESYENMKVLLQKVGYSQENPDYSFSELICELGFLGWLRIGNADIITPADEILICNIENAIENGYLKEDNLCNLGEC